MLISTHVPRAGDDEHDTADYPPAKNFNPRSPCGRRPSRPHKNIMCLQFQPTSPVRETTDCIITVFIDKNNFNPRPPCGRRQNYIKEGSIIMLFQPTSPVRETTKGHAICIVCQYNFNPRPPCGRRPQPSGLMPFRSMDFNPRPPCGRRPTP